MKNFVKMVDWKRFIRFEFCCFVIATVLYIISLGKGLNTFPKNIYIIPLGVILIGICILLKTLIEYLYWKRNTKQYGKKSKT